MFTTKCPECLEIFSRRDVMLRHRRHKHGKINQAYPQGSEAYLPPPPQGGITTPPLPQGGITTLLPPGGIPTFTDHSKTCTKDGSSEKSTVLQHPFTMMVSGPMC